MGKLSCVDEFIVQVFPLPKWNIYIYFFMAPSSLKFLFQLVVNVAEVPGGRTDSAGQRWILDAEHGVVEDGEVALHLLFDYTQEVGYEIRVDRDWYCDLSFHFLWIYGVKHIISI